MSSQKDYLRAAKAELGFKTWDEFAEAAHITPRSLLAYRMPDESSNFIRMPRLARDAVDRLLERHRASAAKRKPVLPVQPEPLKWTDPDPARSARVLLQYREGLSLRDLGKLYEISPETIRKILRHYQEPLRERGYSREARLGKKAGNPA